MKFCCPLGLGVMAVSLWLLFDQQLYLQSVGAESTDYFVGTYIILGVGMLMTLVGKLILHFCRTGRYTLYEYSNIKIMLEESFKHRKCLL